MTRSHDVLKGDEIQKDASVFKSMSELTLCAHHNDREVEYKCQIHDEFICSACIKIGNHRNCGEVEDVVSLADKYKPSSIVEYMLSVQSLRREVENVLHRKINDLEGINRKASFCVEQRQTIVAELRRLLDYYEKLPYKDIKETSESERAKVSVCISDCTGFTDTLSQSYELADVVMKHGSAKQAVVAIEKLQGQSEKVKNELTGYHETKPSILPQLFLPKEESVRLESLKTLLETRLGQSNEHRREEEDHATVGDSVSAGARYRDENTHFGSDECTDLSDIERQFDDAMKPLMHKTNIHLRVDKDPNETNVEAERDRLESEQEFSFLDCGIRKIAEYDISVPSRRKRHCNHQNSVILSDGSMAFIDPDNDCLKLVGSDFEILDFVALYDKPYDLAVTGDDIIGVALAKSVCLYRVNSYNKLWKDRSFLTRDIVYSLCPIGENIGVLFSDDVDETDENYIEIRNRNGRIIRSMDTFRNKNGRECDLHEAYTIRSRYPDELIVSESRQLKAFGLNGNLRWFYKHNGPNVHTIAFDEKKNIYFCDQTAKAIHQISATSFRDHRVLIQNTGIRNPRCILINSKARTLVVGFENNNLVQVYKFV